MKNVLLGIIGFKGGQPPASEQGESDRGGSDDAGPSSPSSAVKRKRGETDDGGDCSTTAPSPKEVTTSRQTLREAARAALRALGGDLSDGESTSTPNRGRQPSQDKSRAADAVEHENTGDWDEEPEEDGVRAGEGAEKGKGKGRAAVKTEDCKGDISTFHTSTWTEKEALGSLLYRGRPLTSMYVADLKLALNECNLSDEGRKHDLRVRLARRLCSDLGAGAPGAAAMKGFGIPSLLPDISEQDSPSSARHARHYNRRKSLTATAFLRKGPDTKKNPILVSSSDDEENGTPAAAAAAADTAGENGLSSGGAGEHRFRRQRTAGTSPEPASGKAETESHEKSLAAGPQPGMTRAELRDAVKALGLKPKGTRKADLVACWREAMSSESRDEQKDKEDEDGSGTWDGRPAEASEDALGGVRVLDMKVAMLEKYVADMGLKPEGKRKADLQRCLREALRRGGSSTGRRPTRSSTGRATTIEKSGSGDDGTRRAGRGWSASQGTQPISVSSATAARGGRNRGERVDDSPAVEPYLDRVRFHGQLVSEMDPEDRRQSLLALEMPSHRMDDDEVTHVLREGLVLRKAEAAEKDPTKQKWRGRRVAIMRKAELHGALEEFEVETSGKVEELRTHLRKELWKWAASEIEAPSLRSHSAAEPGGTLRNPGVQIGEGGTTATEDHAKGEGRGRSTRRVGAAAANKGPARRGAAAGGAVGDGGDEGDEAASSRRSKQGDEAIEAPSRRSKRGTDAVVESTQATAYNMSSKSQGSAKGETKKAGRSTAAPDKAAPKRGKTRVKSAAGSGGGGGGGDDDDDDGDGDDDEGSIDSEETDTAEESSSPNRRSRRKLRSEAEASRARIEVNERPSIRGESLQSGSPPSADHVHDNEETTAVVPTRPDDGNESVGGNSCSDQCPTMTGQGAVSSPPSSGKKPSDPSASEAARGVACETRLEGAEAPPGNSGEAGNGGQSDTQHESGAEATAGDDGRGSDRGAGGGTVGAGSGGDSGGADGDGDGSDSNGGDDREGERHDTDPEDDGEEKEEDEQREEEERGEEDEQSKVEGGDAHVGARMAGVDDETPRPEVGSTGVQDGFPMDTDQGRGTETSEMDVDNTEVDYKGDSDTPSPLGDYQGDGTETLDIDIKDTEWENENDADSASPQGDNSHLADEPHEADDAPVVDQDEIAEEQRGAGPSVRHQSVAAATAEVSVGEEETVNVKEGNVTEEQDEEPGSEAHGPEATSVDVPGAAAVTADTDETIDEEDAQEKDESAPKGEVEVGDGANMPAVSGGEQEVSMLSRGRHAARPFDLTAATRKRVKMREFVSLERLGPFSTHVTSVYVVL